MIPLAISEQTKNHPVTKIDIVSRLYSDRTPNDHREPKGQCAVKCEVRVAGERANVLLSLSNKLISSVNT